MHPRLALLLPSKYWPKKIRIRCFFCLAQKKTEQRSSTRSNQGSSVRFGESRSHSLQIGLVIVAFNAKATGQAQWNFFSMKNGHNPPSEYLSTRLKFPKAETSIAQADHSASLNTHSATRWAHPCSKIGLQSTACRLLKLSTTCLERSSHIVLTPPSLVAWRNKTIISQPRFPKPLPIWPSQRWSKYCITASSEQEVPCGSDACEPLFEKFGQTKRILQLWTMSRSFRPWFG